MFRYRRVMTQDILQITNSLIKVATPETPEIETVKMKTKRVHLVKTKQISVSYKGDHMSAVVHMASQCMNKKIEKIQCLTFHNPR